MALLQVIHARFLCFAMLDQVRISVHSESEHESNELRLGIVLSLFLELPRTTTSRDL